MNEKKLSELVAGAQHFNDESASKKKHVFDSLQQSNFKHPKLLEKYHHFLMFSLAYPENAELLQLAKNALEQLIKNLKTLKISQKQKIEQSGLPYTSTYGAYSYSLVYWLIHTYPKQVKLLYFDEGGQHPKEILKHCLNPAEFDLAANDYLSPLKWLEVMSGLTNKQELLNYLVLQFSRLKVSDTVKDQLFESLKIHVQFKPLKAEASIALGNIEVSKPFFHTDPLLKKFDEQQLISKKLPAATKLSSQEKQKVIEKARLALFLLNRETDPVTCCDEDGLTYFELERGLSIALFSMLPERRLALDAYMGFMMFKNGYPMAYGGAWIFAGRSLLGINIFESYRGGESAYVFCQLLRTYKQLYTIHYFEVEPYQFGKNNPDGIKSGAFWFYYRFRFRPSDADLNELATEEYKKIQQQKGYRTSAQVLKQFTESTMVLQFDQTKKTMDVSSVSQFISAEIGRLYKGDRIAAAHWCNEHLKKHYALDVKKMSKVAKIGYAYLSFFVAFCIRHDKLNAAEKKLIVNFIQEKGNSESDYLVLSNQIPFNKCLVNELL